MGKSKSTFVVAAFFVAAGAGNLLAQTGQDQGTSIVKTLELERAPGLIASRCSGCHDWAGTYETIMGSGLVAAGKPEQSRIWIMIDGGRMPADGTSLSSDQKTLIRDWIAAGAPKPRPAPSGSAPVGPSSTVASAKFFGFATKEDFHRFSGWTSGGVLLAAGIVGAVHAYDMFSVAHAWRDANYPNMDAFNPAICPAEVAAVRNDPTQQALGWTHFGLVAAGETFYIANAITGTSFMGKLEPGWSKSRIHRYAFFAHAGLMAAQVVMGFFTTDALNRGGSRHLPYALDRACRDRYRHSGRDHRRGGDHGSEGEILAGLRRFKSAYRFPSRNPWEARDSPWSSHSSAPTRSSRP